MQHTVLLIWRKHSTTEVCHQNYVLFCSDEENEWYKNHKTNTKKITTKNKKENQKKTKKICQHLCSCCPTWTELLSSMFCNLAHSTYCHHEWCSRIFSPRFLWLHFAFIVIKAHTVTETVCYWLKTEVRVKNLVQMNYSLWKKNYLDTSYSAECPWFLKYY